MSNPEYFARFIVPPFAGPTYDYVAYELGSVLNLEWATEAPSYGIWLWQRAVPTHPSTGGDPYQAVFASSNNGTNQTSFAWTVSTLDFNLDDSPVFFLSLGPDGNTDWYATCNYFNITRPKSAKSTTQSASISMTSHVNTAALPLMTTTAVPSGTTSASSASTETATKVGLGVGLGVGIPLVLLLLGIAAAMFWQRRKSRKRNSSSPHSTTNHFLTQKAELPVGSRRAENGISRDESGYFRHPSRHTSRQVPAELEDSQARAGHPEAQNNHNFM